MWVGFRGLLLYTGDVLFHVECCIRQLWRSSIISCNITSISYIHHTDIYPLLNKKHIYLRVYLPDLQTPPFDRWIVDDDSHKLLFPLGPGGNGYDDAADGGDGSNSAGEINTKT